MKNNTKPKNTAGKYYTLAQCMPLGLPFNSKSINAIIQPNYNQNFQSNKYKSPYYHQTILIGNIVITQPSVI